MHAFRIPRETARYLSLMALAAIGNQAFAQYPGPGQAPQDQEAPVASRQPGPASTTRETQMAFGPCSHQGRRTKLPRATGQAWKEPFDGELLFSNVFDNWTSTPQSYSHELSCKVKSTYAGSVTVEMVCASLGLEVEATLRKTFNINIPAKASVMVMAYANMMKLGFEMMVVCAACDEVLESYPDALAAARGVHEIFQTLKHPPEPKGMLKEAS